MQFNASNGEAEKVKAKKKENAGKKKRDGKGRKKKAKDEGEEEEEEEEDPKKDYETVVETHLPKYPDGTLVMKDFIEYLPTGKYKEEMVKYSDLDVLFAKLKYNKMYNMVAETAFLGGNFVETKPMFKTTPMRIVWGDDFQEDELNAYRVIMLLMIVRHALEQHKSCEECPSPAIVITDIHGQFCDLLRWFFKVGGPEQSDNINYVCTGDMVDRGLQQLETVCLFLYYKARYPDRVFLLRGNHEDYDLHEFYGFMADCNTRFRANAIDPGHKKLADGIWYMFVHVFDYLPVVCLIEKKFMSVHGGISPLMTYCKQCHAAGKSQVLTDMCEKHITLKEGFNQLITFLNKQLVPPMQIGQNYMRTENVDEALAGLPPEKYNCLFSDLLWSDPKAPSLKGFLDPNCAETWEDMVDWSPNTPRLISFMYGHNCLAKVCNLYELAAVIRGHEPKYCGFEWSFKKYCITLFSAPNYSKGNDAAVGLITETMTQEQSKKMRLDPIQLMKTEE